MTGYFQISAIRFRGGRSPGAPPSELEPGHVTVVVGPNNSGKSLLLRELEAWASPQEPPNITPWQPALVVDNVDAIWPPDEAALRAAFADRLVPDVPQRENAVTIYNFEPAAGQGQGQAQLYVKNEWGHDFGEFCRAAAMRYLRMRLDGRQRFALADPRQITPPDQGPSSAIMAIWRDRDKYRAMQKTIHESLDKHFVVNLADLPQITMSLSDEAPPPHVEDSLANTVLAYQRRAAPLSTFSDGIQVYTGLIAAVISLPHSLLLVDEPEAYLHPTLARRLGSNLARIAREREGNLIAATHSADFLIGCVSEVPNTSIVRLTYQRGISTVRVLSGAEVTDLTRDPLLRSANALRALFAQACVVCEADSDRAFYEEINRRLLDEPGRQGADDTIFLNAQNWQTIPTIAAPLRRLGIPAVMIVDLDTLAVGSGWTSIIKAFGVDDEMSGRLTHERGVCGQLILDAGKVGDGDSPLKVKKEGLGALDEGGREVVEAFINELAEYGVFVVEVGELENWLKTLGNYSKQVWVTEMLKRLGAKGSAAYVPPGVGDVWAFLERVAGWTSNPQRLGVPA